jgi:hypothetical protein
MYLAMEMILIFLLAFETILSFQLFYLLITIVHGYSWLTVNSLNQYYKIEKRLQSHISTIDQAKIQIDMIPMKTSN